MHFSQASPWSASQNGGEPNDQGMFIRGSQRRKYPSPEATHQKSDLLSPTRFGFSVTSQTEIAISFDSCSSPAANLAKNQMTYLARMHESHLPQNSQAPEVQASSKAKVFFATDTKVKMKNGIQQEGATAREKDDNLGNCASRGTGSKGHLFQNRHDLKPTELENQKLSFSRYDAPLRKVENSNLMSTTYSSSHEDFNHGDLLAGHVYPWFEDNSSELREAQYILDSPESSPALFQEADEPATQSFKPSGTVRYGSPNPRSPQEHCAPVRRRYEKYQTRMVSSREWSVSSGRTIEDVQRLKEQSPARKAVAFEGMQNRRALRQIVQKINAKQGPPTSSHQFFTTD